MRSKWSPNLHVCMILRYFTFYIYILHFIFTFYIYISHLHFIFTFYIYILHLHFTFTFYILPLYFTFIFYVYILHLHFTFYILYFTFCTYILHFIFIFYILYLHFIFYIYILHFIFRSYILYLCLHFIFRFYILNFIFQYISLNNTLLTWRIWWAPNNVSRWQMGFNSAFKGLSKKYKRCLLSLMHCQLHIKALLCSFNYSSCNKVVLDYKFIYFCQLAFQLFPTDCCCRQGTNHSRENLTVFPISPLLCNYKRLAPSAIWQTAPDKTTSGVCAGNNFHLS